LRNARTGYDDFLNRLICCESWPRCSGRSARHERTADRAPNDLIRGHKSTSCEGCRTEEMLVARSTRYTTAVANLYDVGCCDCVVSCARVRSARAPRP